MGIFGAKPDHPMADPKEARRLIAELPPNDSFKALSELTHWLESVTHTEGFKVDQRGALVMLLDEAAQAPLRKVSREYLFEPRLQKIQENRLWNAIFGYWSELAGAYFLCMEQYAAGAPGATGLKPAALVAARTIRALLGQIKWLQMRYGPMDESIWGRTGTVFALAEQKGFSRQAVTLFPAAAGESSAEREFLRAMVFGASCPDGLVPGQLEIADRVIGLFSHAFVLAQTPTHETPYWFDLAQSRPPSRLMDKGGKSATTRYFGAGKALELLAGLKKSVEKEIIPEAMHLGANFKPEAVLHTLEHLAIYWASQPAARMSQRHRVVVRLDVVHGLDAILDSLDPIPGTVMAQPTESWTVEDISAGGFGASIPQIKDDWAKVGVLLGIKPEGSDKWGVGVMRRLRRSDKLAGRAGVKTLSNQVAGVMLRAESVGRKTLDDGFAPGALISGMDVTQEATVLMKAGSFNPKGNMEMLIGGKTRLLLPSKLLEKGADFDLARFRQMERSEGE